MEKYPRVGVGAITLNVERKIFLSQRGPEAKNEPGKWIGPGGAIEFGETLSQALVREMEEEYGFTVESVELLGVYDHILPENDQHWVSPTFICKVVSGEPQNLEPNKCSAIGWFTRDEMRELPLSTIGVNQLKSIDEKYPEDLPDLYK
jgi:mutator protein MutT